MASSLHHAGQAQEAHNIRELLFVLLDKVRQTNFNEHASDISIRNILRQSVSKTDKVASTLYAIALNNTVRVVVPILFVD
jgi:hypothetical protein